MNPFYHNIDPIIVQFGPFRIAWYGLMYIISFALGYLLIWKNYGKKGVEISAAHYESLFYRIILGVFIGARLGYVCFYDPSYYLSNPLRIFFLWEGGLSFHGGLIGVITASLLFCKKNKYNFYTIADPAMPLVALSLGFGRIGNFINGELYGSVTNVPWAVVFTNVDQLPRHPSQLYESLLEGFLMAAFLQFMLFKTKIKGMIFWLFIGCYGVVRYLIEYIRLPDDISIYKNGMILGYFSMGQLLSLGMIIAAIVGFVVIMHPKP